MSCKDKLGGTHHFACDCREEEFKEIESARNHLLSQLAEEQARGRRLREALEKISGYADAVHVIGGELGTCEHCLWKIATDALENEEVVK